MDMLFFPLLIGMVAYATTADKRIRKLETELKAVKAQLAEKTAGLADGALN